MSDGIESIKFSGIFGGYSDYSIDEESETEQYMDFIISDMLKVKERAYSQESMNINGWSEQSNLKNMNFNFTEKMSDRQRSELEQFKSNYAKNQARYESVAQKTGIPPELIAAIHWRESSGNFDTYLHNGDPLGSPTVHVPAGKLFYDWESAAVDALNSHRGDSTLTANSTDLDAMAEFAERYNGLGYRNKWLPSPYVWAGTDQYTSGKYVADGQFDPNYVDQQLGVMLMIKSIA